MQAEVAIQVKSCGSAMSLAHIRRDARGNGRKLSGAQAASRWLEAAQAFGGEHLHAHG